MTTPTDRITEEQAERLDARINKLEEQLAKLYAKRAGKIYGKYGWGYCACGRQTYPTYGDGTRPTCPDCPK